MASDQQKKAVTDYVFAGYYSLERDFDIRRITNGFIVKCVIRGEKSSNDVHFRGNSYKQPIITEETYVSTEDEAAFIMSRFIRQYPITKE